MSFDPDLQLCRLAGGDALEGKDGESARDLRGRKAAPCLHRLPQVDSFRLRSYSYRRLSTGSSCAARVAGTVPKTIPTSVETTIATIADHPEIGT